MTEDERNLLLEVAHHITRQTGSLRSLERLNTLAMRVEQTRRLTATPPIPAPAPRPVQDAADIERKRILVATVVNHPDILAEVRRPFGRLVLPPPLGTVRHGIGEWDADRRGQSLSSFLLEYCAVELDFVLNPAPVPLPAFCSPDATSFEATGGWWHIYGLLSLRALRDEIHRAEAQCAADLTPTTQNHLLALTATYNRITIQQATVDCTRGFR